MTMTRSAAVSRRAIEPGPGPGLRTACIASCSLWPGCPPPPPSPASANPAPFALLLKASYWSS